MIYHDLDDNMKPIVGVQNGVRTIALKATPTRYSQVTMMFDRVTQSFRVNCPSYQVEGGLIWTVYNPAVADYETAIKIFDEAIAGIRDAEQWVDRHQNILPIERYVGYDAAQQMVLNSEIQEWLRVRKTTVDAATIGMNKYLGHYLNFNDPDVAFEFKMRWG